MADQFLNFLRKGISSVFDYFSKFLALGVIVRIITGCFQFLQDSRVDREEIENFQRGLHDISARLRRTERRIERVSVFLYRFSNDVSGELLRLREEFEETLSGEE